LKSVALGVYLNGYGASEGFKHPYEEAGSLRFGNMSMRGNKLGFNGNGLVSYSTQCILTVDKPDGG
jgi:hypothetical protein